MLRDNTLRANGKTDLGDVNSGSNIMRSRAIAAIEGAEDRRLSGERLKCWGYMRSGSASISVGSKCSQREAAAGESASSHTHPHTRRHVPVWQFCWLSATISPVKVNVVSRPGSHLFTRRFYSAATAGEKLTSRNFTSNQTI